MKSLRKITALSLPRERDASVRSQKQARDNATFKYIERYKTERQRERYNGYLGNPLKSALFFCLVYVARLSERALATVPVTPAPYLRCGDVKDYTQANTTKTKTVKVHLSIYGAKLQGTFASRVFTLPEVRLLSNTTFFFCCWQYL